MEAGDLRWYHITSIVMYIWAAVSRLFGSVVPSPFPMCMAALVFAFPYHAFVLKDPLINVAWSTLAHSAALALAPFDMTWKAIFISLGVFAVHGHLTGFFKLYGCVIPEFHASYPNMGERFARLAGTRN